MSRIPALVGRLTARPILVAGIALAVTVLLAFPFLAMAPTTTASPEPGGPVYDARDEINERFDIQVMPNFFIAEASDGDVLDPADLRHILASANRLREHPELGPLLVSRFDQDLGLQVDGLLSVADVVDAVLREQAGTTLVDAPDALVTQVVDGAIEQAGPTTVGLSDDASVGGDGHWHAEALTFLVLSDNEALGGGAVEVSIGTDDTTKEEHFRAVQEVLAGDDDQISIYGVAGDANLTAADEGQAAGPFIGLTIIGVLLIVGLTFRSYWAVVVIGGALAALIVWLKGLSNLVGLENDQVLNTIVPIALISFGVDFAFHAIGRVREEQDAGRTPRAALSAGLAAVMGALVLALTSDAVAFLSNAASGIDTIIQFGIASTLGLVSAFILLGVVAPIMVSHLEARAGRLIVGPVTTVVLAAGAAATAMGSVLLGVFVHPPTGVALLGVYLLVFVGLPLWRAHIRGDGIPAAIAAAERARTAASGLAVGPFANGPAVGRLATAVGAMSAALATRALVVLPIAALVTGVLGFYAVQIPTEFDVKDFFSADAPFVVALDKTDEHVGRQGGEPGQILARGDLTSLEGIRALDSFASDVVGVDSDRLARDQQGEVVLQSGLLDVVRTTIASPAAVAAVASHSGVTITDADGDGLPDDDAQVAAVIDTALAEGVAFDGEQLAYTPADVLEVFDPPVNGEPAITVMTFNLPGSRAVEAVTQAQADLSPLIDRLDDDLAATDAEGGGAVLTGSPFVRQGSLDAISDSLLSSLPIAILLCFLIAMVFMRSLRHGLIAIVPTLLVVAWLYGVMERTGFAINLVTGTIGAISIGIGIDFAIHYLMRYREELASVGDRVQALRATGEGTGAALVASASSSILGFVILALAPMPLFASYGLLTAMMIGMALVASLVVLPPLLMLATRDDAPEDDASTSGTAAAEPRTLIRASTAV